jgi:hypothetical protein
MLTSSDDLRTMNSVNSRNILPLLSFTQDFATLTGVARARQLLARLIEWTAAHNARGPLLIDFHGVDTASASFLRESVLAFRDYVRAYQPELFPVVANLDDSVREEFKVLLDQRREAMLGCRLDDTGQVSEPEVIGTLEPGVKATLAALRERGPTSPGDLLQGGLVASTLSNRLASLSRQGFVDWCNEGNRRMYRFVLDDSGGGSGG